jgi:hypothetical protein
MRVHRAIAEVTVSLLLGCAIVVLIDIFFWGLVAIYPPLIELFIKMLPTILQTQPVNPGAHEVDIGIFYYVGLILRCVGCPFGCLIISLFCRVDKFLITVALVYFGIVLLVFIHQMYLTLLLIFILMQLLIYILLGRLKVLSSILNVQILVWLFDLVAINLTTLKRIRSFIGLIEIEMLDRLQIDSLLEHLLLFLMLDNGFQVESPETSLEVLIGG